MADDTLFSIDAGEGAITRSEYYANWRGKARKDHPATSKDAAAAITPVSGTQRGRVYEAIRRSNGLTDEALAALLHLSPNSVRPRRVELVERGLVVDSGVRDTLATGRKAIVWRAT